MQSLKVVPLLLRHFAEMHSVGALGESVSKCIKTIFINREWSGVEGKVKLLFSISRP